MRGRINIKRYFQVLGICMAVLFVGLLGALGFGFWEVDEEGLTKEEIATVDISGGKINVLLMGVDEGGLRTDCIMLGSYDTENKTAKLMSIPRDTRMYIGNKYQKINAAHAIPSSKGGIMGAQGTVEAVTRLTGVPINYYVELPFSAVAECIDVLGPVEFEIPDLHNDGVGMVYDDPVQGLHINLKPGLQKLNGEQVVHLLRYRKGNLIHGVRRTYANGDIERIALQQEFLKAFVDQKLNASLILKLPAIFKQLSGSIKTNLTVSDVVKYSKHLTGFSAENLKTFSLPGESGDVGGGSYWICNLQETANLIETEFGYDASNITVDRAAKAGSNKNSSAGATAKPSGGSNKATAKPSAPVQATSKPSSNSTSKPAAPKDEEDEDTKATAIPTKKPEATPKPTAKATKAPTQAPSKGDDSPSATRIPTKE